MDEIPDFDTSQLLKQGVSQGSTGNLNLTDTLKLIQEKRSRWVQEKKNFETVIKKLVQK